MALVVVFDPTKIVMYNNSHAHTHYSTTRMEIGVRRKKRRMKTMMLSEMYVVIIICSMLRVIGKKSLFGTIVSYPLPILLRARFSCHYHLLRMQSVYTFTHYCTEYLAYCKRAKHYPQMPLPDFQKLNQFLKTSY